MRGLLLCEKKVYALSVLNDFTNNATNFTNFIT